MFSSTNIGHCHPYVAKKVIEQTEKLSMANIATHNATHGPFAEMMCKRFGYDKMISMTSGTEAADTACKIARKWGIQTKGISPQSCLILGVGSSYHGLGKAAMNVNPTDGSPLAYGDAEAMRRCLSEPHENVAAVIMECLHGASRTVEEEIAYAKGIYELCHQYNVLFIADEVRQGAGKTGKFLSYEHIGTDFKPDIVTMAAAVATIEVIDREDLMNHAVTLGTKWKAILERWNHPKIDYVNSMAADSDSYIRGCFGPRLAALCMHKGLLVYPRPDGLRISFAMNMPTEDLLKGAEIIKEALDEIDEYDEMPGEDFSKTMASVEA
ncbi:hypothetical protein UA08_01618 [Talaromyces atroroseus]|uniref:Ornithine aminotransferase n=1 Tax=Talaromyces atroroseus TaxID=1441469 RepID=A0A1Q5Q9T5_TALAT|nr:hypothetical protein UA08_01618 [Talaromyces atroroseus]OKL62685.1 hypothetical protein UA08_01618 [Talaromyces atroroseus]